MASREYEIRVAERQRRLKEMSGSEHVCQNEFCGKVTVFDDWAKERKEKLGRIRIENWEKKKFCGTSCVAFWIKFKASTGDDRRLSEEEVHTGLLDLHESIGGTREMTSESLFDVVRQDVWGRVDDTIGSRNPINYNKPVKHETRRLLRHLDERAGEGTRWTYVRLVSLFYPEVVEEFYETHFHIMPNQTAKNREEYVAVFYPDMRILDFIIGYAVRRWERTNGRKMTMDDIHGMWRYPNFWMSDFKVTDHPLEGNPIYELFNFNRTGSKALAKKLFHNSYYSPKTVDLFLLHLEQKAKYPKTMLSNRLRDERGRFVKSEYDFRKIVLQRPSAKYAHTQYKFLKENPIWLNLGFRRVVCCDVVRKIRPSVKVTEKFPYDLSHEDITKVANISCDELKEFESWRVLNKYNGYRFLGIHSTLKVLWPDYKMSQLIWNHSGILAELQIHTLMNDWVQWASLGTVEVEMRYRYPLNWPIGDGTKRKDHMIYMDTKKPILLDLYLPRFKVTNPASSRYGQWIDECVIEIQGPHHYRVVKWTRGVGTRGQSAQVIDDTHPEWEERLSAYKRIVQNDRTKKRRLGSRLVHIPNYRHAEPVKGVHGDLGYYNLRYLTEDNPGKGRHGLAEMFERQHRIDIGAMIREYSKVVSA